MSAYDAEHVLPAWEVENTLAFLRHEFPIKLEGSGEDAPDTEGRKGKDPDDPALAEPPPELLNLPL